MFLLLLLTVEVQYTICNSLITILNQNLAKFKQNQMIRTTQNSELFDKKPFTSLTIFDMSLAPF